jgi:hypothetical protein
MPDFNQARKIGREIREALDRSVPNDSFPRLLYYPSDSVLPKSNVHRYMEALHKFNNPTESDHEENQEQETEEA